MVSFWDSPVVIIGLVSMFVSFVVAFATRLLTKREQLEAWKKEISKLQTEIDKVKRSRDKKSLEKLKKLQSQMLSVQSKASRQSLKVMPVTLITYLLIWWLILVPSYARSGTVAYLPWLWGQELELNLFAWYFLCSILFGILFNKIFGLGIVGD